MGFRMNCDRCDKYMKNVSAKDLIDIEKKGEILCVNCAKVEKSLHAYAEKMKTRAVGEMNKVVQTLKEMITLEIQKQVAERNE